MTINERSIKGGVMKWYNIQGMAGKFWVQERVLWWWMDVLHCDTETGKAYRYEFPDLDAAYAEVQRLRAQDAQHTWFRRKRVDKAGGMKEDEIGRQIGHTVSRLKM